MNYDLVFFLHPRRVNPGVPDLTHHSQLLQVTRFFDSRGPNDHGSLRTRLTRDDRGKKGTVPMTATLPVVTTTRPRTVLFFSVHLDVYR